MRRPLLVLISLGLAGGGVALVLAGRDPPSGDLEPGPVRQQQDRPEAEVAPMSTGDRAALPGGASEPAPVRVTVTFALREQVNGAAITRVDYRLLGPSGQRREAALAKAPVEVPIRRWGKHVVVFRKAGFLPREVEFTVAAGDKDRHLDVLLDRVQGRVRVEVRDRATNGPLAGFKVRVGYPNRESASAWTGPVADTHHDAFLPLGRDALLQVEAPGYTPSEEKPVTVTAAVPEVELVFFLERAVPFTGIELRVVDSTLRPAKKVRVVTEVKQPQGAYQELWNRRASSEDGIYRLPEIKPGTYRLTVRSMPPEGELGMHVPFVREIEFTGGEKYQLAVHLEAGARILLKVTDQEGRPSGEGVQARLLTAIGDPVRTLWEHIDEAGKPLPFVALGANGLVQDGRARLFDPVPPGRYSLQVRRPEGATRTIPIALAAGEIRSVEIKL